MYLMPHEMPAAPAAMARCKDDSWSWAQTERVGLHEQRGVARCMSRRPRAHVIVQDSAAFSDRRLVERHCEHKRCRIAVEDERLVSPLFQSFDCLAIQDRMSGSQAP